MFAKWMFICSTVCLLVSLWIYQGNNCCQDPIFKQNITEIIQSWSGFTAEEHYVVTGDGYELLVERSFSKITQKTPIILVHGIAMNAFGWINRGNVSLAHLLGNLGYDVWMLNSRGTCYSKKHINLKATDREYWNFDLNDLGIQDIRTAVRMVNEKTKQQAIFVGYSLGSTTFFVYSSLFPDEAQKYVKGMVALAPSINFKDAKSILRFSDYWWPYLKGPVNYFWNGEIIPGGSVFLKPLLTTSPGMYGIQSILNLICGDDYEQLDPHHFPLAMTRMLDTFGAELYTHLIQIHISGVFQKYDYGKEENMEKYGTSDPPSYDLSNISVPVSIFYGANDWLATPTNAKQLHSEIKPDLRCGFKAVPFEKWNHIDFLIAKDLVKYLYEDLFNKIKEIDSEKCMA